MHSTIVQVCKSYGIHKNKIVYQLFERNVHALRNMISMGGNVDVVRRRNQQSRRYGHNNHLGKEPKKTYSTYSQSRFTSNIKDSVLNQFNFIHFAFSRLIAQKTFSSQAQDRTRRGLPKKLPLAGVKHVIVVASGKGGVGKSSTAVSLAVSLSQEPEVGNVGLLDADIYGPSIPMLMNLSGQPELNSQNLMIPLMNYGVKCMSMGFLVDEKSAIVWRGLMVMSAVQKLLREVVWGPLDYLIVDLPPGTGDVQLSIVQNIPVSGSVIVTTPQDLALLDARRAIDMFDKVEVPALGVIENMSVFVCPSCGHQEHIFGQNGAEAVTAEMNTEILGQVPLQSYVREACDNGVPVVATTPDCDYSKVFKSIAQSIIKKLKDTPPLTDYHNNK